MSILMKNGHPIRALVKVEGGGGGETESPWTMPALTDNLAMVSGVIYQVSADSIYQSYAPYKVFDGNNYESYWHSNSTQTDGTHWLTMQCSHPLKISGMSICSRLYTGSQINMNTNVKDFILFGSDDGENWTELYSGTMDNICEHTFEFTVNSPAFYKYHKISIVSSHGALSGVYYATIGEIKLEGFIKN